MNASVDTHQNLMLSLASLEDPNIQSQGALYFLEGHFLFRYRDGKTTKSKFVTAADVAAAFTGQDLDTGWQPAGIVRQGQKAKGLFFAYSAPAQKVEIQLAEGETPVTVPIPRTVLLGVGSTYHLWALRSKYFAPQERAYHAPFPNIHDGGLICWGQNTPPEAQVNKARQVWDLFFKTPFNHDLSAGKSQVCRSDVRDQLRALAEKRARAYPVEDLMDINRNSISYLIDQALRS